MKTQEKRQKKDAGGSMLKSRIIGAVIAAARTEDVLRTRPIAPGLVDRVLPALRDLPTQAIHNDANEHNVLVGDDGAVCVGFFIDT